MRCFFTYFYTAITVPTNKMSDDLKEGGGFISVLGWSAGN
jgi:preprotein translocase subunit SecY